MSLYPSGHPRVAGGDVHTEQHGDFPAAMPEQVIHRLRHGVGHVRGDAFDSRQRMRPVEQDYRTARRRQ